MTLNYTTPLRVLLPVADIPAGACVSKRTGEQTFILRHRIAVYGANREKLVEIDGFFLCGREDHNVGFTTQIKGEQLMLWHTTAAEMADILRQESRRS